MGMYLRTFSLTGAIKVYLYTGVGHIGIKDKGTRHRFRVVILSRERVLIQIEFQGLGG
jgi:hypothetical protein